MSLQIQKSLEDKNDQISTLLEQINKLKLDSIHVDQEQMAQQRAIQVEPPSPSTPLLRADSTPPVLQIAPGE